MKQVLNDLKTGAISLVEAPSPRAGKGQILIHTTRPLISAGTERTLVDFGKASFLEKARKQPDKVTMVLEKAKTDGVVATIDAVRSKLDQPLPLGYCNVGVVVEVGPGVTTCKPGDRVASNGPHADVVKVPQNLCAVIPDAVDDDDAAFTVAASIGLQGIRLAQATLGEAFAVIGAGFIGLLTLQLLRAHGCRVLAIDFDDEKLALAASFGAETCNPAKGEDPVSAGMVFSRGKGVDGVIVTATSKSSDPVTQAARMSRKRGRIIMVGITGLDLNRADFYEKELHFQVSCSYGPGRHDPEYEDKGHDYPIGFVRWTEQRNFEAVLDMLADGRLNVKPLLTHRFDFEKAPDAYDALTGDKSALGILLMYESKSEARRATRVALKTTRPPAATKPSVAFIGAGNYASRVLIPAFKAANAHLQTIVTSGGISGVLHGKRAGFAVASTDADADVFQNEAVNTVAIVTRHDTHAALTRKALLAGKHVFVEKPLAITTAELEGVEEAFEEARGRGAAPRLMVGFNRRFAPQIQKMKSLLSAVHEPKSFIMTMNAGAIPADHWIQDQAVGGGRIIGEACHLVDLMRFLAGSEIVSVQGRRMGDAPGAQITEDKAAILLGFADGSFGTVHYLANGSGSFPKERIEVFAAGRVLQLDNFRKLTGYGWPGFGKWSLLRQDKGQQTCAAAFLKALESGAPNPIPETEIFEVSRATIEAAEMLRRQ
jgi:predicted dehydrogenase/threonine dehydrogenase-like Zn-dependent dehydrogenase